MPTDTAELAQTHVPDVIATESVAHAKQTPSRQQAVIVYAMMDFIWMLTEYARFAARLVSPVMDQPHLIA